MPAYSYRFSSLISEPLPREASLTSGSEQQIGATPGMR